MTDVRKLLERQASWQKARAALTWPERVRMAEAVREDAREITCLRKKRGTPNTPASTDAFVPGERER